MNKHIRNISLVFAGFASAVAFQNCSPARAPVNTSEVSVEKPEVVTAPQPVAEITPVPTLAENLGLASRLLKNRKWILESYKDGNNEVEIDEAAKIRFEMSENSSADEDRVCAGDCGRAYAISGSSACGDFSGFIKVRFIESRGSEALGFSISNLEDVCSSEDIIDGENVIAITDQIFQDLEDSDNITLKNNVLLIHTEERTVIFKADKSF